LNGHGKKAAVPGYKIGGKTGTAQIANKDKSGYEENSHIGSFAGLVPADNPRFAMLVKLDRPKSVEFAESSAAPTFGEVAKFLLQYYQIPKNQE
jgi:cell division protein FtsI/penicillin-binding protein 2